MCFVVKVMCSAFLQQPTGGRVSQNFYNRILSYIGSL